jgi:predicted GIY-YIG superfamily endonuclease
MYFVYTLIDQRDNSVRYVGITNDIYSRFSQHLRCDSSNITKNMWIAELKSLDLMLIMRTIERMETVEEARKREVYWMQQYSSQGAILLNIVGSKSITFDNFMSFFQDNTTANTDINDESLPVEVVSSPPPSRKSSSKLKSNVYTNSEAARAAKCSVRDIEIALETGQLYKNQKWGKILKSSLERFIAERKQKRE